LRILRIHCRGTNHLFGPVEFPFIYVFEYVIQRLALQILSVDFRENRGWQKTRYYRYRFAINVPKPLQNVNLVALLKLQSLQHFAIRLFSFKGNYFRRRLQATPAHLLTEAAKFLKIPW